jgi:hypothetical protein
MDLVTCHWRNTRCAQCGKMGNASALPPHGSDHGEVRLRCTAYGEGYLPEPGQPLLAFARM